MRSAKIFAKEIEIPVPSAPEREEILKKILVKNNHSLSDEEVNTIAESTHGFVAADLKSLCNQAVLDATQRRTSSSGTSLPIITLHNIQECMKSVKPSAIKSILIDVPNVSLDLLL